MAQYDAIAAQYAQVKSFNSADKYCFYPRFYEAVGNLSDLSVLDLATGAGKIVNELSMMYPTATLCGIDESAKMIKLAKANSPSWIQFKRGKVGELGRVGQYDVITAGWLLHYAKTKAELRRMCRDIALNLKPGGMFVTLNGNPNCFFGGAEKYGYWSYPKHKRPLAEGDIVSLTCFGNGAKVTFEIRYWNLKTYFDAMRSAGLYAEISIPQPTDEGIQIMGSEWWAEYRQKPTTAIFKCRHLVAA